MDNLFTLLAMFGTLALLLVIRLFWHIGATLLADHRGIGTALRGVRDRKSQHGRAHPHAGRRSHRGRHACRQGHNRARRGSVTSHHRSTEHRDAALVSRLHNSPARHRG